VRALVRAPSVTDGHAPLLWRTRQLLAARFCDVAVGSGDPPVEGDLVVCDYTARAVATGAVFDGSRNFKFTLGAGEVSGWWQRGSRESTPHSAQSRTHARTHARQVIPGWEQGILGNADGLAAIRAGGSRTLLIPPELAYGAQVSRRVSCERGPACPVTKLPSSLDPRLCATATRRVTAASLAARRAVESRQTLPLR
jgi:hypothetical protein